MMLHKFFIKLALHKPLNLVQGPFISIGPLLAFPINPRQRHKTI